jgi:hypothetical protein
MITTRLDEKIPDILPKIIHIPFPEKKYKTLLKILELDKVRDFDESEIRKIFIHTIYLFLEGSWSTDDLSEISNMLWGKKEEKFDELGSALYSCTELGFYIRNVYNPLSPTNRGNFETFLLDVMKYYEKYVHDLSPKSEFARI